MRGRQENTRSLQPWVDLVRSSARAADRWRRDGPLRGAQPWFPGAPARLAPNGRAPLRRAGALPPLTPEAIQPVASMLARAGRSAAHAGPGIPVADQPRIFDKFYRGSNIAEVEGSGLGLAIVKTIVESHQGRIWVESIEGKGSSFFIVLPVLTEPAAVSKK